MYNDSKGIDILYLFKLITDDLLNAVVSDVVFFVIIPLQRYGRRCGFSSQIRYLRRTVIVDDKLPAERFRFIARCIVSDRPDKDAAGIISSCVQFICDA